MYNLYYVYTYSLLGEKLRGDQQLRNTVIDILVKLKVGWSPNSIEIGEI